MKRSILGWLAVLAMASSTAIAHNDLPDVEWCGSGQAVAVANVEIFAEAILAARRDEQGQCPTGRECGQFDDDYGTGRRLAIQACTTYAAAHPGPGDIGTTVFIATGPGSFMAADHHELFEAAHGLLGYCVRCQAPVQNPVPIRQ